MNFDKMKQGLKEYFKAASAEQGAPDTRTLGRKVVDYFDLNKGFDGKPRR